jgi:hypothetical protein
MVQGRRGTAALGHRAEGGRGETSGRMARRVSLFETDPREEAGLLEAAGMFLAALPATADAAGDLSTGASMAGEGWPLVHSVTRAYDIRVCVGPLCCSVTARAHMTSRRGRRHGTVTPTAKSSQSSRLLDDHIHFATFCSDNWAALAMDP